MPAISDTLKKTLSSEPAQGWLRQFLVAVTAFYFLATVDTFFTNFLFTTLNWEGADYPFRWVHRLLPHVNVSRLPADIGAAIGALFTGFVLPQASAQSLKDHPKVSAAIWGLSTACFALAAINMIVIDPDLNGDSGVPGNPYFALQSMNKSALAFSLMLLGILAGFRIPKAEK